MAHVTGGGSSPATCPECSRRAAGFGSPRSSWSVPPVFEVLRKAGHVDDAEMFRNSSTWGSATS